MIERSVKKFVESQKLFSIDDDVLLLAVSGGIDSMVLIDIVTALKVRFSIAHCNFQLRGEESDADQKLVANTAQRLGVPFHTVSFDTAAYKKQEKFSTQQAARILRYEWLEKIRQEFDYQYIATAHHADDSVETFIYNFSKGCGLKGLLGIAPKNNRIIRPFSEITKRQILDFADEHKTDFREDASNISDDYTRNKIRHHVTPVLQTINPQFSETSVDNFQRLRDAYFLMNEAIKKLEQEFVKKNSQQTVIQLDSLKKNPASATLLFHFLEPFGFNNQQTEQMLITPNNGAEFYSVAHKAIVDRGNLLVQSNNAPSGMIYEIKEDDTLFRCSEFYLAAMIFENNGLAFEEDPFSACLDLDKLQFPLLVRHWQSGDYFTPLGMKGKKQKLQDFFSNQKLSNFEKEKVWILESDGKIAWVIGYRIDERFKITNTTQSVCKIKFGDLTK